MNSDPRGIKTIVLSELPKHEKVKYFQFLLDNDINFSKDENGNYVALVKVLNPQFYSDVELQQEKMKEDNLSKLTSKNVESDKQQILNPKTNLYNHVELKNPHPKVKGGNVVSSGSPNTVNSNIRLVNQPMNVAKPQFKKEVL